MLSQWLSTSLKCSLDNTVAAERAREQGSTLKVKTATTIPYLGLMSVTRGNALSESCLVS